MPPASRNHRAPTAGDTPARSAASSLDRPAAIAAQNRRRSSRRATPGRPGERDTPRPDRSERRLRVPIANPSVEALRRPLESADKPSTAVSNGPLTSVTDEGARRRFVWEMRQPMASYLATLDIAPDYQLETARSASGTPV